MVGCRHAKFIAEPRDQAREAANLHPLAVREIEIGRRVHRRRKRIEDRKRALDDVGCQFDPLGIRDRDDLAHHLGRETAQVGVRVDDADRLPGERGQAGIGREQDVLLPERAGDVVGNDHVEARCPSGLGEGFDPGIRPAAQAAHHETVRAGSVFDHARCADRGGIVCRAAEDMALAKQACQALGAVDTVHEGDHEGLVADNRLYEAGGRLEVVELDAEQDDIDRSADGRRVIRRLGR